jgi:transposase
MVMQMVLRRAIHLHHQRDELSTEAWVKERDRLKRVLDWLLKRPVGFEPAQKLQARFLKHQEHILLFLDFEGVEPTNNVAERALRPSVIHRKVTNCFRSEWGARVYGSLASVIDTAELQGKTAFQAIFDFSYRSVSNYILNISHTTHEQQQSVINVKGNPMNVNRILN